jgi:hypothetical protein
MLCRLNIEKITENFEQYMLHILSANFLKFSGKIFFYAKKKKAISNKYWVSLLGSALLQ